MDHNHLFVIYNRHSSYEYGAMMPQAPSIKAKERSYTSYTIPGMAGKLIEVDSTRDNATITCDFVFLGVDIKKRWRGFKAWLNDPVGELSISNDSTIYYKVVMVSVTELNHITPTYATTQATFTILPFEYLTAGRRVIRIKASETLHNPYDVSYPVYTITGDAQTTLTVNGHTFKANVGQSLIIDTYRQLAYRNNNGTLENTSVTGDYEGLLLAKGTNAITYTGAVTVDITPNWGYML